jgi:hypothetical protein
VHGELAQAIAIAAHGSAWLAGRLGQGAPDLETGSTFQYVRAIRFELAGSILRKAIVAGSVEEWLAAARQRGVERLWLAMAGASERPWFLIASAKGRPAETWHGTWTVGASEDPDHRIWDVAYRGRRDSRTEPDHANPAEATERLHAALDRVETFAGDQGLEEWAAVFGAARQLGDAADPVPPYHPDMFPATVYGRSARRLLAMATRSDVFGGMGSWNDVGLASPAATEEYTSVTRELSAAVLRAFVAAVNAPLDR